MRIRFCSIAGNMHNPSSPALPPVVITRPLAQTRELAQRIATLGRKVEILPLLDIAELPDYSALHHALRHLRQYSLVAFVSPNAVAACFKQMRALGLAWPQEVALGVVGQGSLQALQQEGIDSPAYLIFAPRDKHKHDSETLLQAVQQEMALSSLEQVLIVRAEHGREWLAEALRAQQVQVTQVAAYRRSGVQADAGFAARAQILCRQPHDWLITSSEALRHLLQTLTRMQTLSPQGQGLVADMLQQHLIVPHPRIAQTAHELGFLRVTQSVAGDAGLLAALQSRP